MAWWQLGRMGEAIVLAVGDRDMKKARSWSDACEPQPRGQAVG